jgi:hypothetical protein
MHYKQARAMHDPIDWEGWKRKMNEDANREQTEQMVEQAPAEDLRVLVTRQAVDLAKLREQLDLVTMAANLNADTVREQQIVIARLEGENAEMARQLGIVEQLRALRSKS